MAVRARAYLTDALLTARLFVFALLRSSGFTALLLLSMSPAVARAAEPDTHNIGRELPLASVIPFVAMLAAIAVFPLAAPHWWEHNRNKFIVAAVCGVPLAIYLASAFGHEGIEKLEHAGIEYVSFIAHTWFVVCNQRRHLCAGIALRHADVKHGADCTRRVIGQRDRHDRRFDGFDSTVAACQRSATAKRAHCGFLYLRGVQLWRAAHSAGRSSFILGFFERRAFRVDIAALARMVDGQWTVVASVQLLGSSDLQQGRASVQDRSSRKCSGTSRCGLSACTIFCFWPPL